jgi:hypothetical protein
MTWELYEVWSVDADGHEELIDTTKSLKEAREMAETALADFPSAIIYKETEDGDIIEIERLTSE